MRSTRSPIPSRPGRGRGADRRARRRGRVRRHPGHPWAVPGAAGAAVHPGHGGGRGGGIGAAGRPGCNVGQRVYASVPVGGCAETVWAQEHLVAPLPDSLSFAQGAALVVNDHTAHVALVRRAGLRPGESVLVHGAAGGLGSAAVRIAAALGARVTAVASTPRTSGGGDRGRGPPGVRAGRMAGRGSGGRRRGRHRRPDRRRRLRRVAAGAGPGGPAAHPRLRLRPHPVGPGEPVAAAQLRRPRSQLGRPDRRAPGTVPIRPRPLWPPCWPTGCPRPPPSSTTSPTPQAAFTAIEHRDVVGKTVLLVRHTRSRWRHERLPDQRSSDPTIPRPVPRHEKAEIHHERSDDDNASSGADDRCGSRPGQLHADVRVDGPRIHSTAARPGTPVIDAAAAGVVNTGR